MADIPDFYRQLCPHNCRRASWHDYKGPGWYMITLSKTPAAPSFSRIAGSLTIPENPPHCDLNDIGHIIDFQIVSLNSEPIFEIPTYVVMPDHVHLLWRVREWLPKDLGYYVGLFKSRCTKTWRERRRLIVKSHPELFQTAQRVKIADRVMDCYGNFQLLKNPVIASVIVSSRYTADFRLLLWA